MGEKLNRDEEKKVKLLSLVIPCYKKFRDKELILVNDGSIDNTYKLFKKYQKKYKFIKIVSYKKNRGKGYAIKSGVLKASKDLILISDIDLSTPLKEFYKLCKYVDDYEIVIGSRALDSSKIIKKQSGIKVFLGRFGNKLINLSLGLNFKDTQCGFKLFKNEIHKVFKLSKIDGFGYDFEVLFIAKNKGYNIKEVPVVWKNDERSKVKFKHYLITFKELLIVWMNYFLGKYN